MVSIVKPKSPQPDSGEPAWDIATLPAAGFWDERDYLSLDTNYLVEFTDGFIDVLSMPKPAHQRIVLDLLDELHKFVRARNLGEVLMAPMPVRLRSGKFREPDVMFMFKEHTARKGKDFWTGADLVMEVVSPDAKSHERDHATKRADYAEAEIPEYWIVDPQEQKIIVLKLHRGEYIVHGEYAAGQRVESALLPGFAVDVDAVFAAANAE